MADGTFAVHEYTSLRDELLKRIEIRHNIVALAVTSGGVLLGFSLKTSTLGLLFPPLAFCLCALWAQNDMRALQITDYLETLEGANTSKGWTKFYKAKQGQGTFLSGVPISVVAPGSVFLLTALMSLGVALSGWSTIRPYNWLLVLDGVSVLLMVWLIIYISMARISRRAGHGGS